MLFNKVTKQHILMVLKTLKKKPIQMILDHHQPMISYIKVKHIRQKHHKNTIFSLMYAC